MNKNELIKKQGSIVELRNRKMYLFSNGILYSIDSDIKTCINLDVYTEDLLFNGNKESIIIKDIRSDVLDFNFNRKDFDIMKINYEDLYLNFPASYENTWIWDRSNFFNLSKFEKKLLKQVSKFNYIARNSDGNLFLYIDEPTKDPVEWNAFHWRDFSLFNHLFKFVKWSDSKAFSIKELLK